MSTILRPKSLSPSSANYQPPQTDNFFGAMFDEGSDSRPTWSGEAQLSCDVYQDKNNIIIKATMAGVDPKNLDIAVTNDLLTIRGFRELDEEVTDDNYYSRECYWGAFSRSIVLPQEVDQKNIKANLKNGILTVKLPKKYQTSSIKVRQIST